MKKVILCLVLMVMSAAGYAQGVIGKWVTEGGDSQVEIYQTKTGRCEHTHGAHQERRQVGRRQDLQPQERQDLQVFHLARRQPIEGARLYCHVLRDPNLDKEMIYPHGEKRNIT